MSIDSINLEAMNAYKQTISQKVTEGPTTSIKASDNFHKMMEVNFNKLASLTPDQILSKIPSVSQMHDSPAYRLDISSQVSNSLYQLRSSLAKQEAQVKKAAVGEASIVELMTSTTEATNLLSAFAAVKDAAKESWEKIWSMSL
ncbi:MAG: hypothetical protein EB127_09930 [Alphaproteobacteria bacterium]|nr:hypothetical protein [Alphaproteobacteria bacterium]